MLVYNFYLDLKEIHLMHVSLGESCRTKSQLLRLGLGNHPSLPFDWSVTPHRALLDILASDFSCLFREDRCDLLDYDSGFVFAHQKFSKMEKARSTFFRRVERFRALRSEHGITFVRENKIGSGGHLSELRDALSSYGFSSFNILWIEDPSVDNWRGCDRVWDERLKIQKT